jgi:cyclopropane fatty-acyl-phospholipid synthase-like methyltransferase
MDRRRFFWAISGRKVIDNPISLAKIELLIDSLQLSPDARVLDIATGKGETLCRIAARYGAQCTGVEYSSYFCEEARARGINRQERENIKMNRE